MTRSSTKNKTHHIGANFLIQSIQIYNKIQNVSKSKTTIDICTKYKPTRVLYQNDSLISYTDTKYLRVFICKGNLLSLYLQSK